jgi:chaperone BCS1
MDIHVEFKLASKYQSRKLFYSFYLPSDEAAAADDDEKDEDKESDSGYNSSANTDVDAESTPSEPDVAAAEKPTFFGTSHRQHAPKLRRKQVAELAARFSEAIPERELSMAALQGFLMTYKIRPYEAVNAAKDWVESEREAKLKKQAQAQAQAQAQKAVPASTSGSTEAVPASTSGSTAAVPASTSNSTETVEVPVATTDEAKS